jgi:hypothetical protein
MVGLISWGPLINESMEKVVMKPSKHKAKMLIFWFRVMVKPFGVLSIHFVV